MSVASRTFVGIDPIFFIARRSRPGTSAQTNQVDRLISTATTNVLSKASEVREQFSSSVS